MGLIGEIITIHPSVAPLLRVNALVSGKTRPLSDGAGDGVVGTLGGGWWRRCWTVLFVRTIPTVGITVAASRKGHTFLRTTREFVISADCKKRKNEGGVLVLNDDVWGLSHAGRKSYFMQFSILILINDTFCFFYNIVDRFSV